MLKEYGRQLSFAHRRPEDALVLDIAGFGLQVGGFAWLVQSGRASPASAYLATGLACGLVAAVWLAAQRRAFQPEPATAPADLRDNWVLGKWLFAGYVVNACAKDMYGWVLTAFHGTGSAAVLAACLGIVMLASPIVVGVGNHLGPSYARLLAERGTAGLTQSLRRGTWVAAGFVIVLVTGVALFGEWGVGLVYGSQYLGNRLVLVGLALGLGLSILTMPIGVGLLAMQRADLTFRAAAAGAGATLVIGIGAARAFGPVGAALGLVAANALEGTVKVVLFRGCMRRLAGEKGTAT
jgi:O-antigen/teichoic acid export membrane protein